MLCKATREVHRQSDNKESADCQKNPDLRILDYIIVKENWIPTPACQVTRLVEGQTEKSAIPVERRLDTWSCRGTWCRQKPAQPPPVCRCSCSRWLGTVPDKIVVTLFCSMSSPPRWYCWTGSARRSRGRSGCALPPPRPTLGSSRPAQCPAGTRCGSSMSSWPAPPWATCVTCVPARWWCPPPPPQASPPLWPQAPVHHWWWERQGWTPEHEDDGDLLGGEVVHLQGLWGQVADHSHFSATNLREEEREVF